MIDRDYIKMSEEKLDDWIKKTREDFKQQELWDILTPQLDRLVERGSPDLHAFYEDLWKKQLVTEQEINEMKMCYPLDSVSNQSTVLPQTYPGN